MKIVLATLSLVVVLSACGTPGRLPTPSNPRSDAPAVTNTPIPTPVTGSLIPSPIAPSAEAIQPGENEVRCQNVPSDAATINSAIAGSAAGEEIVISGLCQINQTIKLLGDRSYRGTSRSGTILKQADGANLTALVASDTFVENDAWTGRPVSVRHLKFDGNSANNIGTKTAGLVLRSWMSVVEDVYITDMSSDGLRVTNQSANGTTLNTTEVNGSISSSFIEKSGRYGIYVQDSQNAVTDWTLSDNWIAESGMDGIHLENAAGWIIERNNVYRVPQNGIYADRAFATSISDNYIEGFGETQNTGVWYGIYATIQGGAGTTITGNRIFNNGINLNGNHNPASSYRYLGMTVNYDIGEVSVSGNTIRGTKSANEIGLYYSGGRNHGLVVASLGNLVLDVYAERMIDGSVVLSDGF